MTEEDEATVFTEQTMELAEKISEILAGNDPSLQGAALAHLTAMWLAGHQSQDGVEDERIFKAREMILANWLHLVRRIVPVHREAMDQIEDDDDQIQGLPH